MSLNRIYTQAQVKNKEQLIKLSQGLSKENSRHEPNNLGGIALAGDRQILIANDSNEAKKLCNNLPSVGLDSTYGIPSTGVPAPFTTIFSTQMIKQLFKATTLSKITSPWQQGVYGIEEAKIPTSQISGSSALYSDVSMNGHTSLNFNWLSKKIIYLENTLNYGELQTAQFDLAKIPYVQTLREGTATLISQNQNDIGFNGFSTGLSSEDKKIFGLINDPMMPATLTLPKDGIVPGSQTTTTAWSGKTFMQIVRDIRLLMSSIVKKTVGHIDYANTRMLLVIPSEAYVALSTPNEISGKTVIEFLNETYKKLEIIQCPNFESEISTDDTTLIYLMAEHPDTKELPVAELFVNKWYGHRPVPRSSSISEKVSYAMGGVVTKYPFLIARATGV